MVIHIFLLTHQPLDLGLQVFHYTANVSVFFFQIGVSANGDFVITWQGPNEDHFLSYIVLKSKCDVVPLPLLILSYFPLFLTFLLHFCCSSTCFISSFICIFPFCLIWVEEFITKLSWWLTKCLCVCPCLCFWAQVGEGYFELYCSSKL